MKSEYVFFAGERIARRDLGAPGGVFFYFSDHLKTTSIVTDSSGVIKNESDYYPWGGEVQLLANDSNHYKFNGKERDETGLDYYGARYYSNKLGRFVTPDWAGNAVAVPYANFGNPQSLNLYAYVENNPTTLADLDGHLGQSPAMLVFPSPNCTTSCADSAGEHSDDFCGLDGLCWPPPDTPPFQHFEPRADCFKFCGNIHVEEAGKQAPQPAPTDPKTGKPTPPPVPVPGAPEGTGWKWNPDPGNPRGGTWGPDKWKGPNPPIGSWDPDGHWDIDKGDKSPRDHYDPKGNPITPGQAHPGNAPAQRSMMDRMRSITPSPILKLGTAGVIIYIIVDEGSRAYPPRNLVPVP